MQIAKDIDRSLINISTVTVSFVIIISKIIKIKSHEVSSNIQLLIDSRQEVHSAMAERVSLRPIIHMYLFQCPQLVNYL